MINTYSWGRLTQAALYKTNFLVFILLLTSFNLCVCAPTTRRPNHELSFLPKCHFDTMTIEVPEKEDFSYTCNHDLRGKGKVLVKKDPKTGEVVEIFLDAQQPAQRIDPAETEKKSLSLKWEKISETQEFKSRAFGKKFKPVKPTRQSVTMLLQQEPKQAEKGFQYVASEGELKDQLVYILIKDESTPTLFKLIVTRSIGEAHRENKYTILATWTDRWIISAPLSQTISSQATLSLLPDGNAELRVGTWSPLLLPFGKK